MRREILGVILGVVAVACNDPAKPDYEACVASESVGDYGDAAASCTKAKLAAPESKYGKLADEKLKAMQPKIDEIDRAKADADRKADEARLRAVAAAASAQAAEDAKCSQWVTNCLLGHFPDGSEQWTGLQYFNSKSQCEGGTSGMGVPCDPCKCASR